MKDIIKHNIGIVLVAVMMLILYFNGCFKPTPTQPTITVVHDTVWIHHDSIVYSKPQIVQVIKPVTIPTKYKPDSNYTALLNQYEELLMAHLSTNIQQDTLKIDSLGTVSTTDTVNQNKIVGRKWDYSLKERVVTNTITIKEPYKPRNQVYIGGGVGVIPDPVVSGGLLFKNKKDFIIQPSVTYNLTQSKFGGTISAFSLLKFHK